MLLQLVPVTTLEYISDKSLQNINFSIFRIDDFSWTNFLNRFNSSYKSVLCKIEFKCKFIKCHFNVSSDIF